MNLPTRSRPGRRPSEALGHPGRLIAGAFGITIAVGTLLLSLPLATSNRTSAPLLVTLFTATSAVCVTGLITVDTSTYWSGFGEGIILLLIQVGGLGIMTLATLFTVLLARRLSLRARMVAQAETRALRASDVRRVVRNVVLFSLGTEAVIAALLTARFLARGEEPVGRSLYLGVFHAVSAFNNAGFSPHVDSLVRYVTDPWINVLIATAVIIGGIGFPVVFELARTWRRPSHWSVLTRITVTVTAVLLALGTVVILAAEASNAATLGNLSPGQALVAAFFASAMTRTAGFNALDIAELRPETLLAHDALMFIGGGSAGTAGGIKVTTFGLLAYVMWAELRGEPGVDIGRRRVPASNQRQALSVALLGIGVVAGATFALLAMTTFTLDQVLFEVVSAFATVGLSTGITPDLPTGAQLLVVALMFLGRVGPLTLFSALALKERIRRHQLPEERTIVG